MTQLGQQMAKMMAAQLKELPVHLSIQVNEVEHAKRITSLTDHLFFAEMVRPGHVGISLIQSDLSAGKVRFLIERYTKAPQ